MSSRSTAKQSFLCVNFCLILVLAAPCQGTSASGTEKNLQTARVASSNGHPSNKTAGPVGGGTDSATAATLYTIKPGDSLFRILKREFGLTYQKAKKFIELIKRENKITNLRRLRVGQVISISALVGNGSTGQAKTVRAAGHSPVVIPKGVGVDPAQSPVQSFTLEKPQVPVLRPVDVTAHVKQTWEKIVPTPTAQEKMELVQSDGISISLDPVKYPILPAMDGGRILVDVDGKITPTIKSIISETDPGVRIVSESTDSPKRFLGSLIDAGKFYSSAEDFIMEFGTDPKLTVHADFRVERTADSLVNQDVILLNAGKVASPAKLTEFLKSEGFIVHEPFALIKPHLFSPHNRLVEVAAQAPLDIASAVLRALSIPAEENARIEIPDIGNSGISISVTPDRYFHYKGKTYCINYGSNDAAANNVLIPLLEARGIHSITLGQNDDFRKISETILTSVGLSGTYGFQKLWPEEDSGYSLQMSGIMVQGAGESGESLFLTDRKIDRIIRDISVENGIIVQN